MKGSSQHSIGKQSWTPGMNFSSQESRTTSTSVPSTATYHSTHDEIEQENEFSNMTRAWSLAERYERENWKTIDELENLMTTVMSCAEQICKLVTNIKNNIKN